MSTDIAEEGLVVAAYRNPEDAQRVFESLILTDLDDGEVKGMAALVRRDEHNKVHIKETNDTTAGEGVGMGLLAGAFLGMLGGPAVAAAGAAAGAVFGGVAALKDAGFDDESLKVIGEALPPGAGAVVATTSSKAVKAFRDQGSWIESLSQAQEVADLLQSRLEGADSVLLTLVVSETGLSAAEMVSTPESLSVFGVAVSQGGS